MFVANCAQTFRTIFCVDLDLPCLSESTYVNISTLYVAGFAFNRPKWKELYRALQQPSLTSAEIESG